MSKQTKAPKAPSNRTAAERLQDLETVAANLYNISDNVTKDLAIIKNALKLMDNKMKSIIQALSNGDKVTDDVVSDYMVKNNVLELENKVTNLVLNGILVQEDQVSENSFVVGSERNDDGKVVNPRIQFSLKSLPEDLQSKLVGKKSGDKVQFEDGKMSFTLLQSYAIQDLQQSNDTQEAAPTADAATTTDAATTDAATTETAQQTDTTAAASNG